MAKVSIARQSWRTDSKTIVVVGIVDDVFFLFCFPFLLSNGCCRKFWCCRRTNNIANRLISSTDSAAIRSASSSTTCPSTCLSSPCRNRFPSSSRCTPKSFYRTAWREIRSSSSARRVSSCRWSNISPTRKISRRRSNRLPSPDGLPTSGAGIFAARSSRAARNSCVSLSCPSRKFAKDCSRNAEHLTKPSKGWASTDWLARPTKIWWICTMPCRWKPFISCVIAMCFSHDSGSGMESSSTRLTFFSFYRTSSIASSNLTRAHWTKWLNWNWHRRKASVERCQTARLRLPLPTSVFCRWSKARSRSDSLRTRRCWTWLSLPWRTTHSTSSWESSSAESNWTKRLCSSSASWNAINRPNRVWSRPTLSSLPYWWSTRTDANR